MLLMPVAISFCAYSLWMYIHRAGMIRRKDPGPCNFFLLLFVILSHFVSDEDEIGPIVLAWMLGSAIVVNFFVKLYDLVT
jgi:hypothetical protein